MTDFRELMQKAMEMRERLGRLQEELGSRTVSASAGGGMVTAVVNGRQEVVEIRIEREVVNPADAELLQDLVRGAVNEALSRARAMIAEEMARAAGGMNFPGFP